eukprot:scaffold258386_cov24-Prasinocladus_malaysianus.AAC.1
MNRRALCIVASIASAGFLYLPSCCRVAHYNRPVKIKSRYRYTLACVAALTFCKCDDAVVGRRVARVDFSVDENKDASDGGSACQLRYDFTQTSGSP